MINLNINDCQISLDDDHDPILYKKFFDAFIKTRMCSVCEIHETFVTANMHYDENDDECQTSNPAYTYDDTNLYTYDPKLNYFYMY